MMRTIILTLMLAVTVAANAVPARPQWRNMTLSDGTQKKVMLVGDEHFHYYIDSDNNTYRLDSTGTLQAFDKTAMAAAKKKAAAKRAARIAPRRTQTFNPLSGSYKTLVILVNFTNQTFSDSLCNGNPKGTFNSICNEENYTNDYGAVGSVHDYFASQSYDNFDLDFDVVGPVTVSHSYSYYGRNDDANAGEMVSEAVTAVKDSVDFSDYDWNGDGVAEQVIIIYAGYGEATNSEISTDLIWPHQYYLQYSIGKTLTYDNTVINSYLVLNERVREYSGTGRIQRQTDVLAGMGTLCHEFSHSLGLMDHYDTNYENVGMGTWDLMDEGSYGGPDYNGWVPASLTAYERMYLGWLTPTELYKDSVQISNMPYIKDESTAYIIYNKNHTDEYFLLENKGTTGWDSYLPADGLLVTHVDYDETAWLENTVNTGSTEHMFVVAADNQRTYYDEEYDSYPYGEIDSLVFNDGTNFYYATLHNASDDGTYYLNCKLENITQNDDGTISLLFVPDPRYITNSISRITASDASENLDTNAPMYNLAGQRVGSSYRGVVIQNGHKYILK